MTDRPALPLASGPVVNRLGALEPLADLSPPVPPPAYEEVVGSLDPGNNHSAVYPPPPISDPADHESRENPPNYNDGPVNSFDDSIAFLLFSGVPPVAYEWLLNNGIHSPFRLTGDRILGLLGGIITIIDVASGLTNPSLTLLIGASCLVLYILQKYREDCQQFCPNLFDRDYKVEVAHSAFWLIHLVISWYPILIAMRHAGEVYRRTRGIKSNLMDVVAVVLINLSIFASLFLFSYLGRLIMGKLQLPARLRQLRERRLAQLLMVEEAIILIPRLTICVCIYATIQLTVSPLRMSRDLLALESREAAQHTALFVAYALFTFVAYYILRRLATRTIPVLNRFLF